MNIVPKIIQLGTSSYQPNSWESDEKQDRILIVMLELCSQLFCGFFHWPLSICYKECFQSPGGIAVDAHGSYNFVIFALICDQSHYNREEYAPLLKEEALAFVKTRVNSVDVCVVCVTSWAWEGWRKMAST